LSWKRFKKIMDRKKGGKNLDTTWTCAGEEVLLQIVVSLLGDCCSFNVAYRYLTSDDR